MVDGARIRCEDYKDIDIQNEYYEGYNFRVEVTNLLVYKFKENLIHATINYSRSWYDSKLAHALCLLHPKLDNAMSQHGYEILED